MEGEKEESRTTLFCLMFFSPSVWVQTFLYKIINKFQQLPLALHTQSMKIDHRKTNRSIETNRPFAANCHMTYPPLNVILYLALCE